MSLRLPALRERRGDILPLARRAIQACARGTQPLSLSPAAERRLVDYDWPGNARELTNIVQRAAWLASGGRIDAADLDLQALAPGRAPVPMSAALAVAAPAAVDSAAVHEVGLGKDLKERERELILATLRVTGGSRKLAAERLGIIAAHAASQTAAAQGGRRDGAAPAQRRVRGGLSHEQHADPASPRGDARVAGPCRGHAGGDRAPGRTGTQAPDFASLMKDSVDRIADMQNQASALASAYETGRQERRSHQGDARGAKGRSCVSRHDPGAQQAGRRVYPSHEHVGLNPLED